MELLSAFSSNVWSGRGPAPVPGKARERPHIPQTMNASCRYAQRMARAGRFFLWPSDKRRDNGGALILYIKNARFFCKAAGLGVHDPALQPDATRLWRTVQRVANDLRRIGAAPKNIDHIDIDLRWNARNGRIDGQPIPFDQGGINGNDPIATMLKLQGNAITRSIEFMTQACNRNRFCLAQDLDARHRTGTECCAAAWNCSTSSGRLTASATRTSSPIISSKSSKVRLWAPSERARSGSG